MMFKNPSSINELKCAGSPTLKKIRIVNSVINSINTNAIRNVTEIKVIEFENVTIDNIESYAIDAKMGENAVLSIQNSNVVTLDYNSINVQTAIATFSKNTFGDFTGRTINITADNLYVTGNTFKEISANGFILKAGNFDFINNEIDKVLRNGFNSIKCASKDTSRMFKFSKNIIRTIAPHSLLIDYTSCRSIGTTVIFSNNQIDCKCRNIAFLKTGPIDTEYSNLILDVKSNNTCISAPCILPVEIIKKLIDSNMCELKLDAQLMCLLYNDKQQHNEVTTDDYIIEPTSTIYVVRRANSQNGDTSAAITDIDQNKLTNNQLNRMNKTTVKGVFDSLNDFVETLRNTNYQRTTSETKTSVSEYTNRCVGSQCRNDYDRQKALDFYKYVYAQIRSPKTTENKKNMT